MYEERVESMDVALVEQREFQERSSGHRRSRVEQRRLMEMNGCCGVGQDRRFGMSSSCFRVSNGLGSKANFC